MIFLSKKLINIEIVFIVILKNCFRFIKCINKRWNCFYRNIKKLFQVYTMLIERWNIYSFNKMDFLCMLEIHFMFCFSSCEITFLA